MPLWKKIALTIVAFAVLSLIGIVTIACFFWHSITDSEAVKKTADSFMTMSDPLPEGFVFGHGYALNNVPLVEIRCKGANKNLIFRFTQISGANQATSESTPEQVIDETAKGFVPGLIGAKSLQKIEVFEHSTLPVGGIQMPYVIGHINTPLSKDKSTANAFIGVVRSTKSKKLIMLLAERYDLGISTHGPLTIKDVTPLTDAVKSF